MKWFACLLVLIAAAAGAQIRYLWSSGTLTGVSDNDVLLEMTSATHSALSSCDSWELGSTAGSMDVYISGDGTNYLASPIALTDLNSTDPSTTVVATTAGIHYGFRKHAKKIKFLQVGATAVANGYVTCSQM